jgi:hypothetical protein
MPLVPPPQDRHLRYLRDLLFQKFLGKIPSAEVGQGLGLIQGVEPGHE